MKKLFCCLIALFFVIMAITFVINIPSTTFGRYMTSSKSKINFEIIASPGIYISNSNNQPLSDIRWTVIESYEDAGGIDDVLGPVDELSADLVQVFDFAPKSQSAPTEEATTAPTEEATTAPTEEATTAPTEEATTAPTEEATTTPTEEATTAPTEEATTAPIEEPLINDLAEIQLYNSLGITSGQGIRFHISNIDVSSVPVELDNISPDDMHFKIRLLVPDDINNIIAESTQSSGQATESNESTSEATTEKSFSAMALGVQLRVSSNGEDYSNPINASYIYLSEYTSISMNNPDTPYWAFTFCTNDAENYYTLTGGQPSLIHFMITINDSTIDTSRFIIMVEQYHIYE